MRISVRAYAKLNLDLRILGTRPDGFNELRTVFQTVALYDRLTFTVRPGPFVLKCAAQGVPIDDRNLVWRAAALLWRALRRQGAPRNIVAALDKKIPVQGGLGGGSADAAATLVGLSRLWGHAFTAKQLHDVAARLGADVPFFLCGGMALGLGRGDEIHPMADLTRMWIVLVKPAAGVSTRDAYAWYEEEHAVGNTAAEVPPLPASWLPPEVRMVNDLEPAVVRRIPELGCLLKSLRDHGALAAAMSGSGSTVFGLFRGRASAAVAWKGLRKAGWQAILTRTVGREEYTRAFRPRAVA